MMSQMNRNQSQKDTLDQNQSPRYNEYVNEQDSFCLSENGS